MSVALREGGGEGRGAGPARLALGGTWLGRSGGQGVKWISSFPRSDSKDSKVKLENRLSFEKVDRGLWAKIAF